MGATHAVFAHGDATPTPLFTDRRGGMDDPISQRRIQRAVTRAAAGDRDALHDLYLGYSGPVYRHIRAVVRDEHEAQDITQLVFLKLIGTLGTYDARQGPFRPWLLRVARNLAIDQIRRRRAVPADCVDPPEAQSDETGHERAVALHDALRSLSAEQREVLVLRQIVGLRPREIAERLDKTEGSVHALHHRARTAMRLSLVHSHAAPATRRDTAAPATASAHAGGVR
jgi:RNA polymerase sigma-70 factor (ECF subfamily)